MECQHCGKECKSNNSLAQHSIRCQHNPERIKCKSGFKGKTHSPEIRSSLSALSKKLHADGVLKPPPSFAGRQHTKQTTQKISRSMVGNTNGIGRGRRTLYKDIWFKSTWEALVAEYFDQNGIEWKYEEASYRLSDRMSYRPDFFIYDQGKFLKIVEVKGYFREKNKQKFELFKQIYEDIHIELWTKDILKSLSILK